MAAARRLMNSSRLSCVKLLLAGLLAASCCDLTATAQDNPLRFQRPGQGGQSAPANQQKFRAPSQGASRSVKQASAPSSTVKKKEISAKPPAQKLIAQESRPVAQVVKRDSRVRRAQSEEVEFETETAETYQEEAVDMDSMQLSQPSRRSMHSGMEMGHPHMELAHPHMSGCQCETCMCDPGCGVYDPGCGMEAGCGVADPSCGCAEPGCGSCVGIPGPDYWCIPVCFPRLKDLTLWGGVHGFRGPRDFIPNGQSNSNFGFQEGVNISGRAPLVGFLFPELSYQLGYQAFQSRLSGTISESDDRGQQFVTAGVFRRTQSGLQFGAVFDSMTDDLDEQIDLNQVRYEISLKTPRGRELGFWGASSTNDAVSDGVTFETVDQYCGFYRWNFKDGYQGRIWGGATGDGEGILGADFYAPLNDRWSVQTGFNYLIPDQNSGPDGVVEESWNLGINLVWHLGRTARKGCRSPFRPLLPVADNGWMFVDRVD
jgi:hypothetical protein